MLMKTTLSNKAMPAYVDIHNLEKLSISDLHTIASNLGIFAPTKTTDRIIAEIRWTVENEELYQQVY